MGSQVIEAWKEDALSTDERWGHRDLWHEALALGITDRRVVANAAALVETAELLFRRYGGNVPFDTVVDNLIVGIEPHVLPAWWLSRLRWRFRLWQRARRTDLAAWRWRTGNRLKEWWRD